jgi:hypothetical protein
MCSTQRRQAWKGLDLSRSPLARVPSVQLAPAWRDHGNSAVHKVFWPAVRPPSHDSLNLMWYGTMQDQRAQGETSISGCCLHTRMTTTFWTVLKQHRSALAKQRHYGVGEACQAGVWVCMEVKAVIDEPVRLHVQRFAAL